MAYYKNTNLITNFQSSSEFKLQELDSGDYKGLTFQSSSEFKNLF